MTIDNEQFTIDEILLAAHRFHIQKTETGAVLSLADDFMPADKHLSTIDDCLMFVGAALERGHKVNIEVPHGSSRVSSPPST
ncbi:hypothetical protein [Luteimonas sp. MC1750]|uniref:hypothetical protein n=1 Tax=Luteimonas sp. MC1750 TaxID=2799326 RepID=UPI0018F09F88|nr:hypothetical protein [Luteimonas sp. MC1750]MBJ6984004.1 hypothetical protein [Luteimonas sp. MC1750]QQO06816.1 hypothetical protein JGR68_05160 [Luteimonas sp. MC1750]